MPPHDKHEVWLLVVKYKSRAENDIPNAIKFHLPNYELAQLSHKAVHFYICGTKSSSIIKACIARYLPRFSIMQFFVLSKHRNEIN